MVEPSGQFSGFYPGLHVRGTFAQISILIVVKGGSREPLKPFAEIFSNDVSVERRKLPGFSFEIILEVAVFL